jgi:hypothetical protein
MIGFLGSFLRRQENRVEPPSDTRNKNGVYVELPGGLGTRHAAAAGITASTAAVSVCLSQSTGTVSVFKNGHMIADIQRTSGGLQIDF